MQPILTPENVVFVLLSFEGSDVYSQVGGLGVRMTELSRVLAENGFYNHFFFIGDPDCPSEEFCMNGRQILHRWCQWISHYHPGCVYDNLEGKMNDWNSSLPSFVVDSIVKPAARDGKYVVILAEDWHTAYSTQAIDYLLRCEGLRDNCVIFWNINNEFGMSRVDLAALDSICTVTTVSQFMKRQMQLYGLNPRVIPNGIPKRIVCDVDPTQKYLLRESFDGVLLVKVARYDPNKRWLEAVNAIARLKAVNARPHLIIRGGWESYRLSVESLISHYGLSHARLKVFDTSFESILGALRFSSSFDILELDFYIPEECLMLLYAAADAVLANSGYEPFGIVGLEVMAKSGIAIVGNTGEDYAVSSVNSFRLETNDPDEIVSYVLRVKEEPSLYDNIRQNARRTAISYTWNSVMKVLFSSIEEIMRCYNLAKL
jgi:glycosyltransferase involved in cell wall biosynthesis